MKLTFTQWLHALKRIKQGVKEKEQFEIHFRERLNDPAYGCKLENPNLKYFESLVILN